MIKKFHLTLILLMTLVFQFGTSNRITVLAQSGSNLCAADIGMLNGQGRFSVTGLGRFSVVGLEGADATLDEMDGLPEELLKEILDNPVSPEWIVQYLQPFIAGEAGERVNPVYILVVDDFADTGSVDLANLPSEWLAQIEEFYNGFPPISSAPVLTHGDMVQAVLTDLLAMIAQKVESEGGNVANLDGKIQIVPVDISVGGTYELDLIVPQLRQTIEALRETGAENFIINMSFGIIPCVSENGFNFLEFLLYRQEYANQYFNFDVDGRILIENDVVTAPVLYNGFGIIDFFMQQYSASEEEALEALRSLFLEVDESYSAGLEELILLLQSYLDLSAEGRGVVIPIAASGNFADIFPDAPLQPAALPQVIAVGATLGGGGPWVYSQPAHLTAPGAWYSLYQANAYVAGTSFSAPMASMVAALFATQPGSCTFPRDGDVALPPLLNFDYITHSMSVGNEGLSCVWSPNTDPTPTPTDEITPTPTDEVTPTPTDEVTPTPTDELTPTPTDELTPTPTDEVTPTPTDEPTPVPQLEILLNGSFERDSNRDGIPDRWVLRNPTRDGRVCSATVPVHHGLCAYRFRGSLTENSLLYQDIRLKGLSLGVDDILTLRGYAFTKGLVKLRFRLVISYANLPNQQASMWYTTPSAGYMPLPELSLTLSDTPSKVRVIIQNRSTKGRNLVDSMSLLWTDK